MNKYKLLNQIVKNALLESNPVDYEGKPFIEMLCEEPFTDDFLLQITWTSKKMYWYRTTWIKHKDRVLIDAWLEYLKEGDILPLDLSFRSEEGSESPEIMENLLKEINQLKIPVVFENDLQGRDGNNVTLKIGTEDSHVCLSWRTCQTPTEWDVLDRIFEKILLINARLGTICTT